MPQIWPMNWVLLFATFILIYLFFTTIVYFFIFNNQMVSQDDSNLVSGYSSCDWKW